MKQLLLVGAGGHCKACIDVIEQTGKWQIVGIVDRRDSGIEKVLGYPVIGCDDDLTELRKKYDYAFVTVGQIHSVNLKKRLFAQLEILGFKKPTLISPLAYVSKHAKVGKGTIVMHHSLVNANAQIGDNCIINTKALIEHDVIIEDHTHISTSATINGAVRVCQGSFIGSNTATKQGIIIPSYSFIKAGVLVK